MKKVLLGVGVLWLLCGTAFGFRFDEKLLAPDGTTNDLLGTAAKVDGPWAVLGAPKLADAAGSAYFFQWTGTNWALRSKVGGADGVTNDQFGLAVDISGTSAIVGATRPIIFPATFGKAYIFVWNGVSWVEQAAFSDTSVYTMFGEAVGLQGDYAIVGARLGTNAAGIATGVAHVFKRTGTSWAQEATLQADDGQDGDWFGCAVALDGEYAIVGANGRSNTIGGAYIFKRTGTAWTQVAMLNNPDDGLTDFFGGAVDISGAYAIVGTRHDSQMGAYIYRLQAGTWALHDRLPDIYGRAGFYGQAVALNDPYALVGGGHHAILWKRSQTDWIKQIYLGNNDWNPSGNSLGVDRWNGLAGLGGDDELGENAGAAWMLPVYDANRQSEMIPTNNGLHYIGSGVAVDGARALVGAEGGSVQQPYGYCGVFVRTGQYWLAQAQLVPEDPGNSMEFGSGVALAGDYAVVGAKHATNAAGQTRGAAYAFWFDGTNWLQQAKLEDPAGENDQEFGAAVETDGQYALVGAPHAGSADGKVAVYQRVGTNWSYSSLLPPPPLETAQFGWDIGYDGQRAIVGSPQEYVGGVMDAGAAHVYVRTGGVWSHEGRLTASMPAFFAQVGKAVALDDDWAVCGAPTEGPAFEQSGAIYIYKRTGGTWAEQMRIPAPEVYSNGYFGAAVALHKPYLLACANGTPPRWAYLYKLTDTNWVYLARFYAGDAEDSEAFGSTCDLSADHAVVGVDTEYGRKAYLFYREAWDPQPKIAGLDWRDGQLSLSLDELLINYTCEVQRATSGGLVEPVDWSNLVTITPTKPETNWNIPDQLIEAGTSTFFRVVNPPGGPTGP